MSIILQFYPNGEFTQGVDTSKKRKSRPERVSDRLCNADISPVGKSALIAEMNAEMHKTKIQPGFEFISATQRRYTYLCHAEGAYHWAVEEPSGEVWETSSNELPERFMYLRGGSPSLGLSDAPIFTDPPPSRKKCLSMTKSMARNIRNAGFLLQERYGKECLSFLTLTLPNLPNEDLARIADNWGKIVDRLLKWMRSVMEMHLIEFEYVYCTEVQTKRLTNRGEYALHLHMLFRGKVRRRSPWILSPTQVREAWVRCLKPYCTEVFTTTALENIQQIKRSASGYLSKYLSKGASVNTPGTVPPHTPQFCGHWGGMARSVCRQIRRYTIRFSGANQSTAFCTAFLGGLEKLLENKLVRFFKRGYIPLDGREGSDSRRGLHVGVGCLSRSTYRKGLKPIAEVLLDIGYPLSCKDLLKCY